MKKEFDSGRNKIRCRNCVSCDLEKRWCQLKKSSILLNKTRYCTLFQFDKTKFLAREHSIIEAQRRSVKKNVHRQVVTTPHVEAYPLTGNLDKFTTTGS